MRRTLLASIVAIAVSAVHTPSPQTKKGPARAVKLTAEQILDNYEKAIGGREAWEKFTNEHVVARVGPIGGNESGTYEEYDAAPAKVYQSTALPGSSIKVGFDGVHGWTVAPPIGLRTLTGEDLATVARLSHFPEEIRFREQFKEWQLKGVAKVNGHDAYKLEGTPAEGEPWVYYFDTKTWLRLRFEKIPSGAKAIDAIEFDDYREVQLYKVKFPFSVTEPDAGVTLRVYSVEFNVAVDDSIFRPPVSKLTVRH